MADDSWGQYIKDGCIGSDCWVAGVAYSESGEIFEVAADDDNGWQHLFAEEHEETVNEKAVHINETANLLELITTKKVETGLWLGGTRYQVVRSDSMPFKDDCSYLTFLFANGRKGGAIVVGPTYTVIGLYDEEKGQTKNACVGTVLEFCHAIKDS